LNVRVIDWVLEIVGIFPDPPVAIMAPLYVQVPINAGSVTGGAVVATVGTGVGTGVGTVVAGGGTGAGDVQPAARIPTNRTAQTKNSKDFIFTECHYLLFIPILTISFRVGTRIIYPEISNLTVNQEKKWIRNSNCLHRTTQFY